MKQWTLGEVLALPDVTPSMSVGEHVIDGKRVEIPVVRGHTGALWQEPDDPIVTLPDGSRWMVGRLNGQRVRRQMR